MVTEDVRAHIGFSCNLQIWVAELEHDFRFADGEAVLVGDAAAKDEGIVVESEILGVGKNNFAELDRLGIEAGDAILHAVLLRAP